MSDHLIKRGETWHVKVAIPADIRYAFGDKRAFKRSLKTSDKPVAKARSAPLVIQFKSAITKARANPRAYLSNTDEIHPDDIAGYEFALMDDLLKASGVRYAEELSPEAEAEVIQTYKIRTGQLSPFDGPLEDYTKIRRVERKTEAKDRHAIIKFARTVRSIQHVDKKTVRAFVKTLSEDEGVKNRTIKDNLSTLRVYWKWLQDNSIADEDKVNPFIDVTLPPENRKDAAEKVRLEFDAEQIRTLHSAIMVGNDDMLKAIFMLALYTGCRIEELARLETAHVTEDTIEIIRAKTAAGNRTIPIHDDLKPLVKDLLSRNDQYLLPDLTENSIGVRSSLMSKRFGRLKTKLGFDRRYTFHCLRKIVSTQFRHKRVAEDVAADILGHDIPTMTYGTYAGGSLMEHKREAISFLDYGLDLSRFCAAPCARLSHFPFESDGAFPAQC